MPNIIVKGKDSPANMMNDQMKLFTGGVDTLLAKGRIVLVLQVVGRESKTINYSSRKLHDIEMRAEAKSHKVRDRTRGAALPHRLDRR